MQWEAIWGYLVAVRISITKVMEKKLRALVEDEAHGTIFRQLVALVDDAALKAVKKEGIAPYDVIRIIRGVLGTAALLPPNPPPAFLSFIKRRVSLLGLTEEDIEKAAYRAKATYRLPTSVEWIVRTFDRLLSDETSDSAPQTTPVVTGRPGDWED